MQLLGKLCSIVELIREFSSLQTGFKVSLLLLIALNILTHRETQRLLLRSFSDLLLPYQTSLYPGAVGGLSLFPF